MGQRYKMLEAVICKLLGTISNPNTTRKELLAYANCHSHGQRSTVRNILHAVKTVGHHVFQIQKITESEQYYATVI